MTINVPKAIFWFAVLIFLWFTWPPIFGITKYAYDEATAPSAAEIAAQERGNQQKEEELCRIIVSRKPLDQWNSSVQRMCSEYR